MEEAAEMEKDSEMVRPPMEEPVKEPVKNENDAKVVMPIAEESEGNAAETIKPVVTEKPENILESVDKNIEVTEAQPEAEKTDAVVGEKRPLENPCMPEQQEQKKPKFDA